MRRRETHRTKIGLKTEVITVYTEKGEGTSLELWYNISYVFTSRTFPASCVGILERPTGFSFLFLYVPYFKHDEPGHIMISQQISQE